MNKELPNIIKELLNSTSVINQMKGVELGFKKGYKADDIALYVLSTGLGWVEDVRYATRHSRTMNWQKHFLGQKICLSAKYYPEASFFGAEYYIKMGWNCNKCIAFQTINNGETRYFYITAQVMVNRLVELMS